LVVELVRGFVVRGTVVGADGASLADVAVELVEGRGEDRTATDASGRFALTLPKRGGEVVVVQTRGAARTAMPLGAFDDSAGDVDVGVVRLREGGPIAGRVVDERGAPIASASVEVTLSKKRLYSGVTDADGRFDFPGAGDSPHKIRVSESNVAAGRIAFVHGVRGGDPERRIVLNGASSVLVRFFDEAHAPKQVWSARMTVGPKRELIAYQWRTDPSDAIRATFERPGRFDVEVQGLGFKPRKFEDVEVAADRETVLDVTLGQESD
jgi:hypothetical protein